jgi:membrane protein implicated in regulation of membrane protease activity
VDGTASAWLTVYGVAVVTACVLFTVEGRWGWAVSVFVLSSVVDVLVARAFRRRARRLAGGRGGPPRSSDLPQQQGSLP